MIKNELDHSASRPATVCRSLGLDGVRPGGLSAAVVVMSSLGPCGASVKLKRHTLTEHIEAIRESGRIIWVKRKPRMKWDILNSVCLHHPFIHHSNPLTARDLWRQCCTLAINHSPILISLLGQYSLGLVVVIYFRGSICHRGTAEQCWTLLKNIRMTIGRKIL